MSTTDLRRRQTEAEKNVNRLRNCMPEKLTTFCKMHLSFLLELDGSKLEEMFLEPVAIETPVSKKKNATPFSSKKKDRQSSFGAPLTKDNVAQMYQLITFLQKPENLRTEGLFRKTGNVTRQRLLKEWVLEGAELQLNDNTFSPHDVATVLKQLLSDLPEPLLTQKLYEAHVQIVDMVRNTHLDRERSKAKTKQLKALQLLTLLLPRENAILLECLLDLLHKAANVTDNKMTASSLGVVFAPSLLCPRKLSAEQMQSVSSTLSRAISTMIENAPALFTIPQELGDDVANFWREMEEPNMTAFSDDKENIDDKANIRKAKYGSSSAVNTVLTFAERRSPEEYNSAQDTQVALAQLYAHVQSMPESAKKKKLLKQFNRASGIQTPSNSAPRKGKHTRSRTFGESLKKHFPILAKNKQRGSDDCSAGLSWGITKPVEIDDTVANITYTKTPDNKYRPVLRHSPAVHIVDMGASPCNVKPRKRLSDENIDTQVKDSKIPHIEKEISYIKNNKTPCKALFPATPATQRPVAMVSPITKSVTKMADLNKKAMLTPRSRMPMMIVKSPIGSYTESVL